MKKRQGYIVILFSVALVAFIFSYSTYQTYNISNGSTVQKTYNAEHTVNFLAEEETGDEESTLKRVPPAVFLHSLQHLTNSSINIVKYTLLYAGEIEVRKKFLLHLQLVI